MPKTAKSARKPAKKTPAKKSIKKSGTASAKKTKLEHKLMRQSSLLYTKKSAKRPVAPPKKAKATKDWEPGYKKTITMFKNQPDYFQLNAGYKGA